MGKETLFDTLEKAFNDRDTIFYAGNVIDQQDNRQFPEIGNFYVAPATTITKVDELNEFMDTMLTGVSLPKPARHPAYQHFKTLHIGYLTFNEPIATITEEHRTTITTEEPEVLERIGIEPGVSVFESTSSILRRGFVKVYPDKFFAEKVYDFQTDSRRGQVGFESLPAETGIPLRDMRPLSKRNLRVIK